MVEMLTALGRNGLHDWFVQRVTAAILAFFVLFLTGYFLLHPELNYSGWHALFQNTAMKITTFIVFFSLCLHAWIGVWIVFQDYVKPVVARITLQLLVILGLAYCLIWTAQILWA